MLNDTSVASAGSYIRTCTKNVEESETARKLQLYATSIKTSVSTRLMAKPVCVVKNHEDPIICNKTMYQLIGKSIDMGQIDCLDGTQTC